MHLALPGREPKVHPSAWVARDAVLVGEVELASNVSVFYGAVLRADGDAITIDEDSNIQDLCVLHADPGLPVRVGPRVTVGHRAVLHGCTIEDQVLVGIGAIVMSHVLVGADSIVAAGTVLLEGTVVPPRSLVAGVPGKVRRELAASERKAIARNAVEYTRLARVHALGRP